MALVVGTNCGFCLSAPSADPVGQQATAIEDMAVVSKFTSPAGATKVTEIGWWCNTATAAANFDVALYAADGAIVPGEAGTRLYTAVDNAKGTSAGWKKVTVDWTISGSMAYWPGVSVDVGPTGTQCDYNYEGMAGMDYIFIPSLPNPFGGGALADTDGAFAIYLVYTTGAGLKIPIVMANYRRHR
jgi:hypothetical protein